MQENGTLIKTAYQVQRAANEYYDQNKERCNKILNNAEHLASQSAPITEDEIDYSNPIQRDRRLMNDVIIGRLYQVEYLKMINHLN